MGTFIIPVGSSTQVYECWGDGATGSRASPTFAAGGGGGGGYCRTTASRAAGSTITVTHSGVNWVQDESGTIVLAPGTGTSSGGNATGTGTGDVKHDGGNGKTIPSSTTAAGGGGGTGARRNADGLTAVGTGGAVEIPGENKGGDGGAAGAPGLIGEPALGGPGNGAGGSGGTFPTGTPPFDGGAPTLGGAAIWDITQWDAVNGHPEPGELPLYFEGFVEPAPPTPTRYGVPLIMGA